MIDNRARKDFHFHVWWACTQRPFYSSEQCIVITHTNEVDALPYLFKSPKSSPFLHPGDCCYIISWELKPEENSLEWWERYR